MCNGWVYEVEPEGEISPEQDELGQPTGIASCQRAGFSPMLKHEEPLMVIASIVYLVAAGFGISIVPRSFEHIRADGIVYVPIKGEAPRASISLAVRKDNRSALIRNFVGLARPRARAPD